MESCPLHPDAISQHSQVWDVAYSAIGSVRIQNYFLNKSSLSYRGSGGKLSLSSTSHLINPWNLNNRY